MIDQEWLEQIQFEAVTGKRIIGLLGIGNDEIAFKAVNDSGEEFAFSTYKRSLGFHIKEIPPRISSKKEYKTDTVNKKLHQLVNFPLIDAMVNDYDKLYSHIIKIIFERQVHGLVMSIFTPESIDTIPFILKTPGITRRFNDWANLSLSASYPEEEILRINTPSYPITSSRENIIKWANKMIPLMDITPENQQMEPENLCSNPLFIWGGAVLEGFFDDNEMVEAINYIEKHFGRLSSHVKAYTYSSQVFALANLLNQFVNNVDINRFVKFCAMAGFRFPVINRDGQVAIQPFDI